MSVTWSQTPRTGFLVTRIVLLWNMGKLQTKSPCTGCVVTNRTAFCPFSHGMAHSCFRFHFQERILYICLFHVFLQHFPRFDLVFTKNTQGYGGRCLATGSTGPEYVVKEMAVV